MALHGMVWVVRSVQSSRLIVSAVLIWSRRPEGFLESSLSLVRVGIAKRLGSDGSKGSSSSGSNRVDEVVREDEDTNAKAKLPFSTTFHLNRHRKLLLTFKVSLPTSNTTTNKIPHRYSRSSHADSQDPSNDPSYLWETHFRASNGHLKLCIVVNPIRLYSYFKCRHNSDKVWLVD